MVLIKLPIIQVTWELEIIYEWSLKFFKQSSFVNVIIDLRTGLKLEKSILNNVGGSIKRKSK